MYLIGLLTAEADINFFFFKELYIYFVINNNKNAQL